MKLPLQFLAAATLLLAFTCCEAPPADAQTYTVLHNFSGSRDGSTPLAGLTMDRFGNLFGTASGGGLSSCQGGCGTVFELMHKNAGWIFQPLYEFTGSADGANPGSRITIGANGTLYSTTGYGGSARGFSGGGVVFNLKPPAHSSGEIFPSWTESVLYTFGQPPDGANPSGEIAFDGEGNLYGTTFGGGVTCSNGYYCGIAYELTPQSGTWAESILYTFTQTGVSAPRDGVFLDEEGRLYGTASEAVFRLNPSEPTWQEETVYSLDRSVPVGNVLRDPSGNLFGATAYGGANRLGSVYELTPAGNGWIQSLIYTFSGPDGSRPMAGLTRDSNGALYGTTCYGGSSNAGVVFKLTANGGEWTETVLHNFDGTQGVCPHGVLTLDSAGNLFGTTEYGGAHSYGVVFEITP